MTTTNQPDLTELSDGEVETELLGMAGQLAAGQCRFLQLLAMYDRRGTWCGPGLRSCAHWLCWRAGMSLRTAHEHVRVAHALESLPKLTEAFAAGRVSYSKVRAITKVATPDTEDDWLYLALAGTAAHIDRLVRLTRQCSTPAAEQTARRGLDTYWDDDGTLVVRARLTAEQGARLQAALDAHTPEPRSAEHTPDPDQPLDPVSARRADALAAVVEAALGDTDREGLNSERVDLVVHVKTATNTAEVDRSGPGLPRSTWQRIACNARIVALLTDRHDNPLYLGRRHRLVRGRLLQAVRARDHDQCRFPGCTNRRVDVHHIVHWLHGGKTEITNVILVCRAHHTLIHDHGYQIHHVDGSFEFRYPTGTPIPAAGAPLTGDPARFRSRADTLTPTWLGETLDHNLILPALLPAA